MKTPKHLNVCGIPYRVEEHTAVIAPDGQSVWGHIDFGKCLIRIDKGLSPEKKLTILMHELIHAIDEAVGIGLDESNTDRLAVAFLDVIKRNKLDLNG